MFKKSAVTVALALTFAQVLFAQAAFALTTTDPEACLVQAIMQEREQRGVPRLRFDPALAEDARTHSRAMARSRGLFHSPEGEMGAALPEGWSSWGENVGVGGNCSQFHNAFMNSPDHQAILLNAGFNNVAVGAFMGSDGTLWVTELFYEHSSMSPGSGPFWDDDDSVHETDISALEKLGITNGCGFGRYCPEAPLTRGEMAAFLVRALGLPPTGTDYFSDDDRSVFEANIDSLAAAGITTGCGNGRFCADDSVTRGQMAAFLVRAFDLPRSSIDWFSDDDDSLFEADVNALAASGITVGCGSGHFCPGEHLTRAEMASFLVRALHK